MPSYNPTVSVSKSPLKSHPYATYSKGEPLMLSLSTTVSMGSEGLRKAQSQSITFCSECLGNLSGSNDLNERSSTWVVHIILIL